MIELVVIIAIVMAIAGWLKRQPWISNGLIPLAVVVMAVAFNLINAYLFGGDLLEAGKMAFITAVSAIGIHSGIKNTLEA